MLYARLTDYTPVMYILGARTVTWVSGNECSKTPNNSHGLLKMVCLPVIHGLQRFGNDYTFSAISTGMHAAQVP